MTMGEKYSCCEKAKLVTGNTGRKALCFPPGSFPLGAGMNLNRNLINY